MIAQELHTLSLIWREEFDDSGLVNLSRTQLIHSQFLSYQIMEPAGHSSLQWADFKQITVALIPYSATTACFGFGISIIQRLMNGSS